MKKGIFTSKVAKVFLMAIVVIVLCFQVLTFASEKTNAEVKQFALHTQSLANFTYDNTDKSYLITSYNDLLELSKAVMGSSASSPSGCTTYSGVKFKQVCDITIPSSSKFRPIGYHSASPFQGTYNGQNYAIRNFNIISSYGAAGLFGYVKNATIQNVVLESGVLSSKAKHVGGIVGHATASSSTTIKNCLNMGVPVTATATTESYCGGIVGYAENQTSIQNCYSNDNVTNNSTTSASAGGIVGYCYSTSTTSKPSVSVCWSKGGVQAGTSTSAKSYAGGIIGRAVNTSVTNCLNDGQVKAYAKEIPKTTFLTFGEQLRDDGGVLIDGFSIGLPLWNEAGGKDNYWAYYLGCMWPSTTWPSGTVDLKYDKYSSQLNNIKKESYI